MTKRGDHRDHSGRTGRGGPTPDRGLAHRESPDLDSGRPSPRTFSRRAAIALGGAAALAVSTAERAGAFPAPAGSAGGATAGGATAGGATAGGTSAGGALTVTDALRPAIAPRDTWGADLPVVGEIAAEDDVRFLLVHHTASRNDYGPDDVVGQIREFYGFHTGSEKGWPDVAYNFFVDRFGGIWEARAGSIDGPVRGDATGGSQGFALLCCLIGDHSQVEVSPEALDSMSRLLAWLAERHGVDTAPGATVEFTSRGSNRWPAGSAVTANTISGHRDMSQTACPGDFAYGLLGATIPNEVSTLRAAATDVAVASTRSPTTVNSTTSAPNQVTMVTTESTASPGGDERALGESDGDSVGPVAVLIGTAAAIAAIVTAGAARFRRRTGA
ncbi:MAG: N-acetylmuramoyl-L-alanine amidase [Acidimicrobiales bacterium]